MKYNEAKKFIIDYLEKNSIDRPHDKASLSLFERMVENLDPVFTKKVELWVMNGINAERSGYSTVYLRELCQEVTGKHYFDSLSHQNMIDGLDSAKHVLYCYVHRIK